MINYLLYQTLQEYQNTTGSADLGTIFCYNNTLFPFITLVFLVPLFLIIMLATFFATKRAVGRGDIVASLTAASFVNMIVAGILSLTNCMGTGLPLVSSTTLIISIGLFVVSGILLLITRD